jgi:hypothetical protein
MCPYVSVMLWHTHKRGDNLGLNDKIIFKILKLNRFVKKKIFKNLKMLLDTILFHKFK